MQILLHHIPGATSYTDLKTFPDGVANRTFKETAIAMGLLESDEEADACLSEAAVGFMPKQLRSLFVTILIVGEPAKPIVLWEMYKEGMGEDIFHHTQTSLQMSDEEHRKYVDNEVLLLLQEEMEGIGTCLERFRIAIS